MRKTTEGGTTYEHSLDHAVEFFSKAGSLFEKKRSFYGQEESALSLFQKIWIVDKVIAMKLLFWLRDCRGGAGNRSGARSCYEWLAEHGPKWIEVNLGLLPKVGRWDDLRSLYGSPVRIQAVKLWAEAIKSKNLLAAKWADRNDVPIRHYLGLSVGDFRRLLAKVRKDGIVEHKMCTNRWREIEYKTVPSVAMARYTNAFGRHDEERFNSYKEKLKEGKETVHASVLFPHDCVRTVINGDSEIGNAQFKALPNYLEGTNEKIMVISDTSGSMSVNVSGSVEAVHISQGMALYCSEKIGEGNPFYKKFIGFCSEGNFKDWNGMSFSEAIYDYNIFDRAVGSTRIDKALMLILKTAKFFNLGQEQLPTTLLIISDMQFHSGVKSTYGAETNKCMNLWKESGYQIPKIVYWNTAGYCGSPETVNTKNVALVSGFSPSVLKAIFTGDDLTPVGVMLRTLEKYQIEIP